MGWGLSDDQPDVAPELGTLDTVFQLSGGHSQGHLTNAIESLNMSLRKVIKTRGSFPNAEAALKLLYLALEHIAKKWTMPVQNWKAALQRFAILLGDRVPQDALE
jgi:transposase-like protein